MKTSIHTTTLVRLLLDRLIRITAVNHPAAGWFKQGAGKQKKRTPMAPRPKIMSPDSVHLRGSAKKDPVRKNPAP